MFNGPKIQHWFNPGKDTFFDYRRFINTLNYNTLKIVCRKENILIWNRGFDYTTNKYVWGIQNLYNGAPNKKP